MLAKIFHEFFDFIPIFKACPEKDFLATGEGALGFIKEPGQVFIISFDLVSRISILSSAREPAQSHTVHIIFGKSFSI